MVPMVVGLDSHACELVVHVCANVGVADPAGSAIPAVASPPLVVGESDFHVLAACVASSSIIEFVPGVVKFDLSCATEVADPFSIPVEVCVGEKDAAVVLRGGNGAEHWILNIEALARLTKIGGKDNLLFHEKSTLIVFNKLLHRVEHGHDSVCVSLIVLEVVKI